MKHTASRRLSAAIREAIQSVVPAVTYRDVAASTGIPYQVLTNMILGRTKVTAEALDAIRRYLNLPESWPEGLTLTARRALSNVTQESYTTIYAGSDRLPLIHPGDTLEVQPSPLPRIGTLNLLRSGGAEILAHIDVEGETMKADRPVDLSTAGVVGYIVAVFAEDGLSYCSERGVDTQSMADAIRRRS